MLSKAAHSAAVGLRFCQIHLFVSGKIRSGRRCGLPRAFASGASSAMHACKQRCHGDGAPLLCRCNFTQPPRHRQGALMRYPHSRIEVTGGRRRAQRCASSACSLGSY
jgi:hypothetical protein